MRRAAAVLVVLVTGVSLLACGTSAGDGTDLVSSNEATPTQDVASMSTSSTVDQSASTIAPAASTSGERVGGSEAWRLEGERLREAKSQQTAPEGMNVANAGDWALQSEPINVVAPGEYIVRTGPAPDWFDYPANPQAFSFNAPQDSGYLVSILSTTVVSDGASRYLELRVRLEADLGREFMPYANFTLWLY